VNLTHLKAFYMVAKNKSFTLACKDLDISQPTISFEVQELEKHCGFPLLIRDTKHVELTHEGEIIFHFAEKIFALTDEIENTIADINNPNMGTLKLGATFLTLRSVVPCIISPIKSKFPGLKIQLFSGSAKEILQKVMSYEYHIGIIGRMHYSNHIISKQVQRMKLYFISKSKMGEKIYLRNLANYPIICPSEESSIRELIVNEFKNRSIPLNIQLESDDPLFIKSMVEQGMGGAFVTLFTIKEDLGEGKFEIAEIQDSMLYLYLDAIFLRERRKSHYIKSVVSAIDNFKCSKFD
jgi:DNA-binding transcriptional LysR family regulator